MLKTRIPLLQLSCWLLWGVLGCQSCDMPIASDANLQNAAANNDIPSDTLNTTANPETLLATYFEALKTRDHKTIQSLLFYTNKFYLQEPQPIIQWDLAHIEELTREEADGYDLKPNPIQEDLLVKVKVYTIDEYKKITRLQYYFLRENKQRWGFVNRIGADTCAGIFLKYGENALDFKEYKVLQQRVGQYLVQILPHIVLSVDEKTQELGKIVANRACKLTFIAPDALYCGDELVATWLPDGTLEARSVEENNETQDSLKTE